MGMQINILGMGVMGSQIAALVALSGCRVNLWSRRAGAQVTLINREMRLLRRFLTTVPETAGELAVYEEIEQLPDCLTIETVTEDLDAKKAVIARLRTTHHALLFSNSSSYRPDELGPDVRALHFFNPISHMKLIEYIDPDQLSALQPFRDFVLANGFTLVPVHPNRGYIGNFMLFSEISAFFRLLELWHYDEAELKAVCACLGHRNAFEVVDFIGVDVCLRILENLQEGEAGLYVPELLRRAVRAGILGKKNNTSLLKFYQQEKTAAAGSAQ